jgi:hypothetical protein
LATERPLGRPGFWIALVYALVCWASASHFVLARPLAACGIVLAVAVRLAEDERRVIEQRVRQAMTLAGLTVKAAAIAYYGEPGRDPEFVRALCGERPLDIARLEIRLGTDFAQHYALLTLLEKGPPTYIRKTLRMVFAPDGGVL